MGERQFKFQLKQMVALDTSNETGTVVGRAEYTYAEPSYLVRYKAGDGRQVDQWWTEEALEAL